MPDAAEGSPKSMVGVLEENNANGNGLASVTSETQMSPRVSTVDTDEPSGPKQNQHNYASQEVGQEFRDYSAPGLDSLHWAGVKKRGDFDARSVASSMNAERDDKSIYEEPAVGAVEEAEEEQTDEDEDDDEEEPEEINLNGMGGDPSSRSLDMEESGPMRHDDHYNENLSPRENRIAESSVAPSDADAASIRPLASEDGEMDEIDINSRGPTDAAPTSVSHNENHRPPTGSSTAPSSAASPRSLGLPPSPLSRESGDFDTNNHHEGSSPKAHSLGRPSPAAAPAPEPYRSSLMRKVTGTDGGGGTHGGSGATDDSITDDLNTSASNVASGGTSAAPSLSESASAFRNDSYIANSPRKEDVLSSDDKDHLAAVAAAAAAIPAVGEQNHVEVPLGRKPVKLEPLEVEGGPATAAAAAARTTTPPPSSRTPVSPNSPTAALPHVDLGPEWEDIFKGLIYIDGVDALGRPVVVLNADCVPPKMKSSALTYVKAHLEPLVNNGHYVIIFTARKAKLPSFWIMGAYQSLPRPFRKNVQYVILVKPSAFLRAVVAFMRPFVSQKAGKKIKAVESLEEIGAATGGEVTMQHLGEAFLEMDAAAQQEMEQETGAVAAP